MLAVSCASSSKTIPTTRFSEYAVTPASLSQQAKQDVSVEVDMLTPTGAYNHPELFSFDWYRVPEDYRAAKRFYPEDDKGKGWVYTFGFGDQFLTACKVKITNNTPHILRMKDARVYLVVPGEDPVAAITKLGNARLMPVGEKKKDVLPQSYVDADNSLVHWLTHFERDWEQRSRKQKKGLITLSLAYPIGFASQVVEQNKRNYRLINDLAVEILPNFSYEGILLFPVIVSFDQAKLMFYDITTKTDPAGNPVEKTSFEFPMKLREVTMWFDRKAKRWKEGTASLE
jgi:hypothetical protein